MTDHQIRDLTNKIADEIVMRAQFLTCLNLDKPPVKTEDGQVSIEPGTKISLFTLRSSDDQTFLPLFTDAGEMEKWDAAKKDDVTRVIVNYEDMINLLHSYHLFGFVINPFTDNYAQSTKTADAWFAAKNTALKMAQKKMDEMKKEN